jgi:iron complex transport system ATP-binding protein
MKTKVGSSSAAAARQRPNRPRPPLIEIKGLRVVRDNTILECVDWRVERNQHWVILGANGSGKTSLLRALAGYLPPTAGDIAMLGETYGRSDWRVLRTRVGLVSSALYHMMEDNETALKAVLSGRFAQFGLWEAVTPAQTAEALRILRQIECTALRDRPWGFLSQGERQRILIGRALMARPRLLILDEPCAGLDPIAREQFLRFIERLARRPSGPALVLVTHHTEEITPSFSHVLVLKAGCVIGSGPKEALLSSRTLTQAFGAPVTLRRQHGRYYLTVKPSADLIA